MFGFILGTTILFGYIWNHLIWISIWLSHSIYSTETADHVVTTQELTTTSISTSLEKHVNLILHWTETHGTQTSPGSGAFGCPLLHLRCQRPAPSPRPGQTRYGAGHGLHGAAHVPRPGAAVRRGLPGRWGAHAHAPRGAQRVLCRTGVEEMEDQWELSVSSAVEGRMRIHLRRLFCWMSSWGNWHLRKSNMARESLSWVTGRPLNMTFFSLVKYANIVTYEI